MTPPISLFQAIRTATASPEFVAAVFTCLDDGETKKSVRRRVLRVVESDLDTALILWDERKGAQP